MAEPYKLLVFDWDGTLMDSAARIVNCLAASMQDIGLQPHDEMQLKDVIGLGMQEATEKLLPEQTSAQHQLFVERYRHHFVVKDETPSQLFAGAKALIKQLDADGYFLAVATGKARRGLDRVLEETEMKGLFHVTRCADETRSKPHPQMLQEVMDFVGAWPEETLMIGDTEYDLLMAGAVGCPSLAVSYGVHEVERLMACKPEACIDNITELYPWLQNRQGKQSFDENEVS